MPWSNQGGGGGPWGPPPGNNGGGGGGGGSGGGPWSRPPGSGGPQTPLDLEGLLRKGQDKLRQVMPGGLGGIGAPLLIVAALVLLWLASGIYRVLPDERGVVLRFGEFVRYEDPGLRYHLPSPVEAVYLPRVTRVNRIEIGYRTAGEGRRDLLEESQMLTGDENIINIGFSVFWQIKNPKDFLFQVRDPESTVKRAAESAMREVIGRTELQPALTEARQKIEIASLALLQNMLDGYQAGVEVTQVQMLKSDPPASVVDAFNNVQRARADRERLRNEAEAYRNDVIPRARGDAERLSQEAQAYREQVVSLAQGDAARYLAIYQAYALSKEVTSRRMYLETMESILRTTNKIILDTGAGGVVPYLPLDQLMTGMLRHSQAGKTAPSPAVPSPQPSPQPAQPQTGRR
ncbi:modulator of FtsH protease HflK [uncultured Gammaproteobacteria bacterium]